MRCRQEDPISIDREKSAVDGGIGAVETDESAILRRRVEELETENKRLRHALTGVDAALPAREALLNEAEKVAHLGSWFLNPVTHEVKWSEELFRILGYDASKVTATTERFFQAIHPDDLPDSLKNMSALQITGSMVPTEMRVLWKDGTVREIRCDGSVIRDEDGNVFRVVGTVLDVTEPRRDRRQATRIARFLQEAQSVAKVGSLVWESETRIIDWSSGVREILGLAPEKTIDLDILRSLVHPDDLQVMRMNLDNLAKTGRAGPVEIRSHPSRRHPAQHLDAGQTHGGRGLRAPAHARDHVGHNRAQTARRAIAPIAEDGSGGARGRRRGP